MYSLLLFGAIALSHPPPPRVRVRATVKLSATFFHDESSITIGGVWKCDRAVCLPWDNQEDQSFDKKALLGQNN